MRAHWTAAVIVGLVLAMPGSARAQFGVVHNFGPNDPPLPQDALYTNGLVQASDGNFYGTSQSGGDFMQGTVYRMTPAGTVTIIHSFTGTADGGGPQAALIQARDGNLYGVTSLGSGATADGTVFKITLAGSLQTLHAFNKTDGSVPFAELLEGADGNLYGSTVFGGDRNDGVIYRISTSGSFAVMHSFQGSATDGAFPRGALIQAFDGNFYGTTVGGGPMNIGTVFKMTPAGSVTMLHGFGGPSDGNGPKAALVQAIDGNLYGTAYSGGAFDAGTVFRISTAGAFTLLHSFSGVDEGASPTAPLLFTSDLNFYGMTQFGPFQPAFNGLGTIFTMTLGGTLSTVHQFTAGDGRNPIESDRFIHGSDGTFYGTTLAGGLKQDGVAFRMANSAACDDSLKLSFSGGTLGIGFTLRAMAPSTWQTWLLTSAGTFSLWSASLPAISPAVSFTVPLGPMPNLGEVFVLTVLSAPGGPVCVDLKGISTAP